MQKRQIANFGLQLIVPDRQLRIDVFCSRKPGERLFFLSKLVEKLEFETLPAGSCVEDAVECLIRTTQHEFPIVDSDGQLRGILTRDDMIRALRDDGPRASVIGVMRTDIPIVHPRSRLDEALRLLQEKQNPAVGVVDSDGHVIGLGTPENIGEMVMVQAARPAPAKGPISRPEEAPPAA